MTCMSVFLAALPEATATGDQLSIVSFSNSGDSSNNAISYMIKVYSVVSNPVNADQRPAH